METKAPQVETKYTAIWTDRWQSGSHWHCLAKIKRIELEKNETVADALTREGIADSTDFLFVGWPKLQGEE